MLDFKELWKNHPAIREEIDPCRHLATKEPFFTNQCAIRMGVCLGRSGFDLSLYSGRKCWHHPESENHTLRVMELIKYLRGVLPKEILTIKKSSEGHFDYFDFDGLTGIVAFQDFWDTNDNGKNDGDHIDLWDGDKLAYGDNDYFERSDLVYFWEIE